MRSLKRLLALSLRILFVIGTISPCLADVVGDRPLLVVLVQFPERGFGAGQTLSYYRTKIFGPQEPNVTDYYDETSHGRFRYVPATTGESYGTADGLVRVTMDGHPEGAEFRTQALELASSFFDYGRYDADGDGEINDQELTVLAIQANRGFSGKVVQAHEISLDGVTLANLPVAVVSELAPNYTIYHELGHAVDFLGVTGRDLYNIRDGIRQKAIVWSVDGLGSIRRQGSTEGEIATELDATRLGSGSQLVSAYRDQNGQLGLASYDASSVNFPQIQSITRAGDASDLSIASLSSTRVVTALRLAGGRLKLIVWDVDANGVFTRRGDYTPHENISGIEVAAVSATRFVVAFRLEEGTEKGNLKLIAFDVSAGGNLARQGDYTAGRASEINLVRLSNWKVVTAVRDSRGDLKVIVFDLSNGGDFTRLGSWHAGTATNIDLAVVSNWSYWEVATSVRDGAGNLKVILFSIDAQGNVTREGDYEGNPVSDLSDLRNLQLTTSFPATSIAALSTSRLAVSYRDPITRKGGGNLQLLTLNVANGALTAEGTASAGRVAFIKPIQVSDSSFATTVQLDGQIWTGNYFGLLGANTGQNLVHFDPYTKLKLGWLPYTEITSDGDGAIFPMGGPAAQAVIIRDPNHRETEYFIVEARSRDSIYESGLYNEGLAIWHVDEDRNYPRPFVSLEWLGGSPRTACWDPQHPALDVYNDRSSPAGSRWNDYSSSGISISQVQRFLDIFGFHVNFE